MIYQLYLILSYVSLPFICLWVFFRKLAGKESNIRYKERFGLTNKNFKDPSKKCIWIHAASIGETVSVIPVIKRLEKGGVNVILTTITRTSAQIAKDRLPKTVHQFVPYDQPIWLNRFLNHWKPDILMLIESEFWPNMLMQAAKRGIPIHLINARFSPVSFRRWRRFGVYFKSVFEKISFATTPHKQNLELLIGLGVQFCRYMPNLKFLAPPLPYKKKEHNSIKEETSNRDLWVGASVRAGEESTFSDIAVILKEDSKGAILSILIPRHKHVVERLIDECDARGLKYVLRSHGKIPQAKTDVWIIDTFGELGLFYSLTNTVLMGGTFANCGAHNPIEAIILGNAVIMGPSRHNFLDIIETLNSALILVDDKESAIKNLKQLISSPRNAQNFANKGIDICNTQAAILEELPEYILESFQKKNTAIDNHPLTKKQSY